MRCLAVAEVLINRGFPVGFASLDLPPPLVERLCSAGCHFFSLSSSFFSPPSFFSMMAGSAADISATSGLLLSQRSKAFFLDGYDFSSSYRRRLRTSFKGKIATFDDLADHGQLFADIVINPSPVADLLPYPVLAPEATLLLGPSYAPLRKEFLDARRFTASPLSARHVILISLGGSDPLNLTASLIASLLESIPIDIKFIVVSGAACTNPETIATTVARGGSRVEWHQDSRKMAELIGQAGLAIVGAGGTAAELATLGTPAILVVVADNQAPAAHWAEKQGMAWVIDARISDRLETVSAITTAAWNLWKTPALRQTLAERAQSLIDGLGAERIAETLIQIFQTGDSY
jgi:UDP-2,4-diacetamido-2,4,6-trideoxy-beta-L-altropyranose hydrolase